MQPDDHRILAGARILTASVITTIMTVVLYGAIGLTARGGGASAQQLERAQFPVLALAAAAACAFVLGLWVMAFGVPIKTKSAISHDRLRPSQREC